MERMAAFDENFRPIPGAAPVRGQPLPDGMYTLVCKVLIKHKDGTILITQRDPAKKFGGGMWEISGGGTAQAGEDGETCIRRETFEETGIRLGEIKELSCVCLKGMRSFFVEYLAETDWEKDDITLQPGETVAYRWVTKEELLAMPVKEIATPWALEYLKQNEA